MISLSRYLLKGGDHPFVEGRPSLEEDPISDPPVSDDPVQIVLHDGVTEPGNQVILLGPLLLVMDQIGFDEDRAPLAHPHRALQRRGQGLRILP